MRDKNVLEAFKLYMKLSNEGKVQKDEATGYMDEAIRGILTTFAEAVDTTIISAGDYIYLIPLTVQSEFHISNQELKDRYLPSKATNMDIYLMYLSIIIFMGEFYDSYLTTQPTRDFLKVDDWMQCIDNKIQSIKQMDEGVLIELEQSYEYNWLGLIKYWDNLDIINEKVKKQTARTSSRKSLMHTFTKFLIGEDLAKEIGDEELALTEKAKVIVQRFFMDYEYNRGIIDIIYSYSGDEGVKDANNI